MELLKSLAVDSAPSPLELFKFALTSLLRTVRGVLLLYPINIILFTAILFLILRRIVAPFKSKKKFQAVYEPLRHHESGEEEAKVLKKEIREVQQQLIEMLKNNENQYQPSRVEEKDEEVEGLLREQGQRAELLQAVEMELKQTVEQAYSQLHKMSQ